MSICRCLLVLASLTLSLPLAADDPGGAASPQDLMRAVGAALAKGDREGLVLLIDVRDAPKDVPALIATHLIAGNQLAAQREAVAKRFGDAAGARVARGAYLLAEPLDWTALAEDGVLERVAGGTAKLSCAKPGAATRSIGLVEREARWFLDLIPTDPAKLDWMRAVLPVVSAGIAAFSRSVADLLGSDVDAAGFDAGVTTAGAALRATLDAVPRQPVERTPIGGPSGDPVSADRLRGARLSYIKGGLVWTFEADQVAIVAEPGPLPADLVERLLGKAAVAASRITAKWTCDGRSIELTELAAGEVKAGGPVKLAIGTAGHIRVDLGDGRQYNVLDKK